jgi:hypothetical protein
MAEPFSVSVDVAVPPERTRAVVGDPSGVPHAWFVPHGRPVEVRPNA